SHFPSPQSSFTFSRASHA
ncbi:hypothetical protein Zm00014a_013961, partial [Zea mays]